MAFTFTHNEFVLQFAKLIIKSRQVKVNVFTRTHTHTHKIISKLYGWFADEQWNRLLGFPFPIVFFFSSFPFTKRGVRRGAGGEGFKIMIAHAQAKTLCPSNKRRHTTHTREEENQKPTKGLPINRHLNQPARRKSILAWKYIVFIYIYIYVYILKVKKKKGGGGRIWIDNQQDHAEKVWMMKAKQNKTKNV